MAQGSLPLVILTGFLGAGKTTVLNRVLGAQHHRRLAVIVNELGRIDVDGQLLRARAGDVVELAGGCVCHEVRTMDELWEAFAEIQRRAQPDAIVLETTGIAEPEALLEGMQDKATRVGKTSALPRQVVPSRVVTVVDAEVGAAVLDRHPEARAQVVTADRLLLSKLDLAGADQVAALHRVLDRLNTTAERAGFPATAAGTAALVPWLIGDLRPRLAGADDDEGAGGARPRAHGHAHAHSQLAAVALVEEAPLLGERLLALCGRLGSALVRAKGFVHLAGEQRRGFLERAGAHLELRLGEPWPPGPRRTEVVLIGDDLDALALQRQLWACRAGGDDAGKKHG
jgi:G3E family GTPase